MDSKNKGIIVVAVVIVLIVAVFAAQALNDKNKNEDKEETNSYYFYLDGMDSNNGWYSADATNIEDAFLKAMESTTLTVKLNDGWMTIDECPASWDSATMSGVGLGIFGYTSTDVSQPSEYYFGSGPVISDLNTNIVYITYSKYTFGASGTEYEVSYKTTTEWKTGGPFAAGADYVPLEYNGYSIYLDGFGNSNGWYDVDADNAQEAFVQVAEKAGLKVTFSDSGWVTIEGYESGNGKGVSIYTYLSSDLSQPSEYNFTNSTPVMKNCTGEVLYVVYGGYTWDSTTGTLTYDSTPGTNDAWKTAGPFAA